MNMHALAQQASEKALKALFQKLGAEVYGHSVAGLIQKLPKTIKVERNLLRFAKELDKMYIPTRYPNAHPEGAPYEYYTKQEAKRMVKYARRIIKFCEGLLSKI